MNTFRLFGVVLMALFALSTAGPDAAASSPFTQAAGAAPAANPARQARVGLNSSGGPDAFGYTWDDAVNESWIEASDGSGVRLGFSGASKNQSAGPIDLGFTFPYYENSYTSLYIAASGYVGFTAAGSWPYDLYLPSTSSPNNVIAPFATPLTLPASGGAGVYYERGGSAPNRTFTVEWYQVSNIDSNLTYEVVLHENGAIVFQYGTMNYGVGACSSAGIENSNGTIGIGYRAYCWTRPNPNSAVRFTRPGAGRGVWINKPNQGSFTYAGGATTYDLTVRNVGQLGQDSFDILVSSNWQVVVVGENYQPLSDTTGDGNIDTGLIQPNASKTIRFSILTPAVVNMGDSNIAAYTIQSAADSNIKATGTLRSAAPAIYAQAYRDDAEQTNRLLLARPSSQRSLAAAPVSSNASNLAILETAAGFAYFWTEYVEAEGDCEIKYSLLDKNGQVVRAAAKLTNHSGPAQVCDQAPAVAAAANGSLGVVWYREEPGGARGIYFAVLNPAGNVAVAPLKLNDNSGQSGVYFWSPAIAAAADNNFVLAWEREERGGGADLLANIYSAVRDSGGGSVLSPIARTTDDAGQPRYYRAPVLIPVNGNQILLGWKQKEGDTAGVAVMALNTLGNALTSPRVVTWDVDAFDMVQLSGGKILLAGGVTTNFSAKSSRVDYVLLNGADFSLAGGPAPFNQAAPENYNSNISVTADPADHGIVTWLEQTPDNLYNLSYALVDSAGSLLTQPMPFAAGQNFNLLVTGGNGFSTTTFHPAASIPPQVDLQISAPAAVAGVPLRTATVEVQIQNNGASTAPAVQLRATFDSALSFAGAEPAPSAVIGQEVRWDLADLGYMGYGIFKLNFNIPERELGSRYPVTFSITSGGDEVSPDNNSATIDVVINQLSFLALIGR